MALADIKARIKTQLEAVSGIGKVYSRMLYVREDKDVAAKLVQNNKLNVWLITRESTRAQDKSVVQNPTEQTDNLAIHGFYGLDDDDTNPSEAAFDLLADAVLEKINADRRPPSKLNGTVELAHEPFIRVEDQRIYGPTQVLCHHVEILLAVVWRRL